MKFGRVLVAIDFSHHSDAAARLAASLARGDGGRVMLYHADGLERSAAPASLPPKVWEAYERDRDHQLRALLDERVERLHRDGLTVEATLQRADAVAGIMTFAREWNADLLVMGSHGADAAERLLFGSVAAWVARRAPCPVLVTRHEHGGPAATGRFHHPLVGIDYSRFSEPIVRLACHITAPSGAMELIHIAPPVAPGDSVDPGWEQPMIDAATEHRLADARTRLCKFVDGVDLDGCAVHCAVEIGRPAQALIEHVERAGNDLIVVGSHSRETQVEMLLGTVADRVLRHAHVPILLLPETALGHTGDER